MSQESIGPLCMRQINGLHSNQPHLLTLHPANLDVVVRGRMYNQRLSYSYTVGSARDFEKRLGYCECCETHFQSLDIVEFKMPFCLYYLLSVFSPAFKEQPA